MYGETYRYVGEVESDLAEAATKLAANPFSAGRNQFMVGWLTMLGSFLFFATDVEELAVPIVLLGLALCIAGLVRHMRYRKAFDSYDAMIRRHNRLT